MSEHPDKQEPSAGHVPPSSAGPSAAAVDVVAEVSNPQASTDDLSALAALREAALRAAGVLPERTLPAGEQPRFWLRPNDQFVAAGLVFVMLGLMSVHWIRLSDWGRKTVEIDRLAPAAYQYQIDINRATWVEWAQFDGIGEALARRIVDDRDKNGPFRSVEDVLRVRGIGPAKFAAMRDSLRVNPP
jgi:competence ComEA-like helix-hairpin-helix protein